MHAWLRMIADCKNQIMVHCFWQISGETVGEVRPVADMHQRKAEMARQSDAFIALPGEIYFTNCQSENVTVLLTWCSIVQ